MKCSQCSTELPATTTSCPQCGSSTSARPTSTFSYLPPDTPPWPSSVPARPPHLVESMASSPDASLPPQKTRTKANRRGRSIVSSIAVLVLVPVIGALITFASLYSNGQLNMNALGASPVSKSIKPTATATAQPKNKPLPAPTSFKTAKDNNVNVSLQYPADWSAGAPQQSASSTSLSITQQEIGIAFSVNHLSTTVTGQITSVEELNQSNVQQLSQVQDFHQIEEVNSTEAKQSIAGDQWAKKEATVLDGQNNKLHFTTIADKHNKNYYVIYFIVPDNIYQEALNKYLTPMLKSIKFLS
ncbi:hypothetical protein KDA_25940 [Dictyobacter alpinus]|uniref:Zinc-ribbon domain-containing protein n=1 Tax=Dictyobacter alpinus TaxID=2014873 RepID=A0A402B721_9CHLR|nr:hypothetical protein [Dictyobacter alpinus]GCE27110.1 hypothetical protein KDA_25940 [Dictyobacter alpinus]